MHSYLPVVMATLVGVLFVGGTLTLSRILRPYAPNPTKLETYECGPPPIGDAWQQFSMRYYIFALLFVLFDVEAAFLFPWAVAYKQFGLYARIEMVVFVGLLAYGWLYALRRGALEWE